MMLRAIVLGLLVVVAFAEVVEETKAVVVEKTENAENAEVTSKHARGESGEEGEESEECAAIAGTWFYTGTATGPAAGQSARCSDSTGVFTFTSDCYHVRYFYYTENTKDTQFCCILRITNGTASSFSPGFYRVDYFGTPPASSSTLFHLTGQNTASSQAYFYNTNSDASDKCSVVRTLNRVSKKTTYTPSTECHDYGTAKPDACGYWA